MRSCLSGQNQRQFHREAEPRIRVRTIPSTTRRIASLASQNVIVFRTRTSTVPDRAPLLRASPTDRHLYCRESRRRLWNPNRTSVQHRLLVASVTTSSAPPEKQIFQRQGAPGRSRSFVGWTVERRTKIREFRASLAT